VSFPLRIASISALRSSYVAREVNTGTTVSTIGIHFFVRQSRHDCLRVPSRRPSCPTQPILRRLLGLHARRTVSLKAPDLFDGIYLVSLCGPAASLDWIHLTPEVP
jgi:hypothetical protein